MNAWTQIEPCAPTTAVEPVTGALTLYYVAAAQQAYFSLLSQDRFGHTWALQPGDIVTVYAGGQRLMPDDGTGVGDYVVNAGAVNLFNPAGPGEQISIDVFSPSMASPPAPVITQNVIIQNLAVTAPNTLQALGAQPQSFILLFVNGRVFTTADNPQSFYVTGQNIVWTSSLFSLQPTDQVIAFYGAIVIGAPPAPAQTLYYGAAQGQTAIALWVSDEFGNNWVIQPAAISVYAAGSRLALDTGDGSGGFILDSNTILLMTPAGQSEQFVVDRSSTGSTLYYRATQRQTAFPLATRDIFGHSWSVQPTTVSVYAAGSRLMLDPGDGSGGFTITGNTVTLINPAGSGQQIIVDDTSAIDTLYYVATQGQATFPMETVDLFGNNWTTQPATLSVYAGGVRLTLDNGSGSGGYTVGYNTVTLINPAGAGQQIIIDGAES